MLYSYSLLISLCCCYKNILKTRSLGSPLRRALYPAGPQNLVEKASYLPYKEGLGRPEGGYPPPGPPWGPGPLLPTIQGLFFGSLEPPEGPRSLSRGLWRFWGSRAPGPGGHGFFRGTPPMVSGRGNRGPGAGAPGWGSISGPGRGFGPILAREKRN